MRQKYIIMHPIKRVFILYTPSVATAQTHQKVEHEQLRHERTEANSSSIFQRFL